MDSAPAPQRPASPWAAARESAYRIIFGTETFLGRAFDIALLVLILGSLVVVSLESVDEIQQHYGAAIAAAEWTFTVLFTIEYIVRCATVRRPLAYMRSFFGVVDLLSIIPTWLSLIVPGSQSLSVIRSLRLLRMFRVLKLARLSGEAQVLAGALFKARHKIAVFVGGVFCSVVISGALMYFIESPHNPRFANIPVSIYWAVVTLTTVGYGDIKPETPLGQGVSACIMLLGYGIIAVPTGIVSAELAQVPAASSRATKSMVGCATCSLQEHELDADFCRRCGAKLDSSPDAE